MRPDQRKARLAAAARTIEADRVAGALLGVHTGDALGATLEFSSWSAIREQYPDGLRDIIGGGPFDWPPGHATDDTDLTRAVLLAYLPAAVLQFAGEFTTAGGVLARRKAADRAAWPSGSCEAPGSH